MQNPRHLSMKIRAHVKREIFNLVGTVDSLDLPSVSFQDIPFNKIPAKLRHRRYKQPAILSALDSKVKLLLTNDHYCFSISVELQFFFDRFDMIIFKL